MICKNCGASLEDWVRFCTRCGAKIENPAMPPAPGTGSMPAPGEPAAEIPVLKRSDPENPGKKAAGKGDDAVFRRYFSPIDE